MSSALAWEGTGVDLAGIWVWQMLSWIRSAWITTLKGSMKWTIASSWVGSKSLVLLPCRSWPKLWLRLVEGILLMSWVKVRDCHCGIWVQLVLWHTWYSSVESFVWIWEAASWLCSFRPDFSFRFLVRHIVVHIAWPGLIREVGQEGVCGEGGRGWAGGAGVGGVSKMKVNGRCWMERSLSPFDLIFLFKKHTYIW